MGRKSHLFCNERNWICCGLTLILWRAQIVEGKYCPQQRGAKQHQELGKMVGMVLIMCKPIVVSVKTVVFDSGFFVVKGVIELEARSATILAKECTWR